MTTQEKFIAAMEGKPIIGLVPHFELVFFLTMESFGRVHPFHRVFGQWDQMSQKERNLQIRDVADTYVQIAKKYDHCAIFVQDMVNWADEDYQRCMEDINDIYGEKCNIIMHGDATFELPSGDNMMEFSMRMFEDPEGLKKEAEERIYCAIEKAKRRSKWGTLSGFALCSDYCFNNNPFFSPDQFEEFVYPYLKRLTEAYREMGYYVIKHTDGNIMPILDMLANTNPNALHSIDPQGGVDIAEVKKMIGDKITLVGNVNCGSLQTGTETEIEKSVRYALQNGMPNYRYIFSTSNTIYTGMPLERYELMLDIYQKYGNY